MVLSGTISEQPRVLIMPAKNPDYLGPTDAAALLGVSRSTFYRLWESGELGNVTIYRPTPRRPLFKRSDLEAWMRAKTSAPIEE